jgi:iron complex outermembrane receptor protein
MMQTMTSRSRRSTYLLLPSALAVATALAWAGAASAQQADPGAMPATSAPLAQANRPSAPVAAPAVAAPGPSGEPDIIVTAERRETRLQETPVALTVISGDALGEKQVRSALDVASDLPSVSIGQSTGQAQISVRGIGFSTLNPGDEGRVAYYVDGVYIARPSAQLGSFFDVDRVEVLRGPQGTLYGRNATGGAFNVFTRQPTREATGYLDVTFGNYGLVSTEGALSGPISSTLSARVAAQTVNRGGYGRNVITGESIDNANSASVRGIVRWEPSPVFRMDVTADYHREDDRNYALLSFGPGLPGVALDPGAINYSQDVAENTSNYNRRRSYGVGTNITYDLSDTISAKATIAYKYSNFDLLNGEGTPQPFAHSRQEETSNQFSAEFQLDGSSSWLNWATGVYYFREKISGTNRAAVLASAFGGPNYVAQGFFLTADLYTDAIAGYGQATASITDKLSLTLGARYSSEKKRDRNDILGVDVSTPFPDPSAPGGEAPIGPQPGFPQNQDATFNSFTPKVTIDYKITPDIFVYATYSQGFKSGGFNYATLQQAFKPERLTNYEGGIKTTWFDKRLRANLSVFHYDYTNIQTQIVSSNPPGVFVQNSGKARIQGLEVELMAKPVNFLQLDATLGLLDTKFGDFITADPARPALGPLQIGGNHIPQAPSYTLNLGAQVSKDIDIGKVTLRGEYRSTGRTYFTIFNTPETMQRPFDIVSAYLTVLTADKRWHATAFVKNIGNTFAATSMFIQFAGFGGGLSGSAIAPRTYGLTLGYKF